MGNEKTKVALTSVLAAVLLTGAKLAVGLMTGSLGILSEAAHSGLDLLAAGMTWWAVSVADRPADQDHPYGHEKIENLSALFETLLLLLTCAWIIYEALARLFFKTTHVEVNAWSYGVVIGAIVVDFSRSRALGRIAKKTRSAALEADALHFSSDIYSSLVVLLGLLSTQLGYPQADAIAALGVALFVIWISFRLGRKAVAVLTDRVPQDHIARAQEAVLSVPGVRRVYEVRVREAGAKHFVDLKVAMDRGASLEAAHDLTERVEAVLKKAFKHADVLVHAEPDETQAAGLSEEIIHLGDKAGARTHALQISRTDAGLEVEIHLEWPCATEVAEAHRLVTQLEENLKRKFPEVTFVQSHLECACHQAPQRRDVTGENKEAVEEVSRAARSVEGVSSCGAIRISEAGNKWWIRLTCEVPAQLSLHDAHLRATEVEEAILRLSDRVVSVSVHTEPRQADPP
jgi:cation diffusion facilitator family transporter